MSQTSTPQSLPQDELDVFERAFAADDAFTERSFAARRILTVSAALIYRDGSGATSIRDITNACGLSPGAFYKHFASKDDLLFLLVCHGHDRLESRLGDALAGVGGDPVSRFAAFVHAYVLGHLEQPEVAQLTRREYLHLSDEPRAQIVRRRRRLREQLRDLLEAGAHTGRIALIGDDARASTRSAVMVLDMCSRTSEWYDRRRPEPPGELAERYVAAALRLAGAA